MTVERKTDAFVLQSIGNGLFTVSFEGNPPQEAHSPAVDYLINQLNEIEADAILARPEKSDDFLKSRGLANPEITVIIEGVRPEYNNFIKIGSRLQDDPNFVYAMTGSSNYVYKVRAELFLVLASPGSEYVSRTLFSRAGMIYDYFVVEEITVPGTLPRKVESRKLGNFWETGDALKKSLDALVPHNYYSKANETLETLPPLSEIGLAPPAYKISFSYNINPLRHYLIGQDTGKEFIYILLPEQSVVTVDKSILGDFKKLYESQFPKEENAKNKRGTH